MTQRRAIFRNSWLAGLIQLAPYAAALLLLLALRESRLIQKVNLLAYDVAVQRRAMPSGATTPIRIIGIDEADLKLYGPTVPDAMLADAIETLDDIGVRAVGLDMFCGQGVGAGQERLRRLAANNSRLVSIFYEPDGRSAIPGTPPERQAYVDFYFDPADGVVRRDLVHVLGPDSGPADVALPMRLLEVASGTQQLRQRLEGNNSGQAFLHPGAGGYHPEEPVTSSIHLQRMLAFHRPGSFPTINLRTLLGGTLTGDDRRLLQNSIVLIGITAPSKKDTFPTPFSLGQTGERRQEMPGVEVHAHRLASLLALAADRPLGIQAAPVSLNAALLVFSIAAGILVGEGVPSLRQSLSRGVVMVILLVAAASGALLWGLWLNVALPLAVFGLLCIAAWTRRGADQQRKRHQLQKHNQLVQDMFGRFVSPDVAAELLTKEAPVRSETVLRQVTILMADLRGFSLISQQYPPETIVRLLNIYLESMVEVVHRYGGTVDEVLGDSIVVLFGAPIARDDHPDGAMACAVAMQIAMEGVNATNLSNGLPVVAMGIGICTGEVMVGTIGSTARAKYGVVGSAVNMASRIEEHTVGGEILVAESTLNGGSLPLCVLAEYQLQPKGSPGPLRVFSIAAIGGDRVLEVPRINSHLVELRVPIDISFRLMDGKNRAGSLCHARVTHVGDCGARLGFHEEGPDLFANLALRFPGTEEDVYAKVRSRGNHTADIHYTYVPGQVRSLLALAVRQANE